MTKERLAKVFHKFLSRKEIIVDGFVFEFNDVNWDRYYCVFSVNVVLPNKNWSYLQSDMEQRVIEIIEEKIYPIYGEKFTVRIILTINSQPSLPCYINKPKLNLLISNVNNVFSQFRYNDYFMDLKFNLTPEKYHAIDDGIEIPFNIDVNLSYKEHPITFKDLYSDEVFSWVYACLNTETDLNMDVADYCWEVLNDQLRLLPDSPITSVLNVTSINGKPTKRYSNFPPTDDEIKRIFILKNA